MRRGLGLVAVLLLAGVTATGIIDPNAFEYERAPGVLALAPAVSVPFLLPALTETAGLVLALVACGLTWVGYVPPRWLVWTWARRDGRRLAEAEAAALRDPKGDMADWLDTFMQVLDAQAAWLEVFGQPTLAVGRADGDPPASGRTPRRDGVHATPLGDRTWLLVADVPDGRLSARTRLDPVLFGDDGSDLFLLTAARMRGTLVRQALERRERADAAARQRARHDAATSRLREDVLSTLSHELRTPLVTLRGVPETLLRRWDEVAPDDARALLGRMHHSARALHRLVESALLLAQVRAGELRAQPSRHTTVRVVREALRQLGYVGVALDRVVVPDGDDDGDVPVRTDPRLAGAVLAELVHNALTYSDAPAPVRVSVDVTGDHVGIGVQDQGRGMGSEPGSLLEAFDRAGELLTRDRRGLGIGLTLVSELAPLLDATLTVASADGGGTVVTLLLPRRLAAHETAEASPGDGSASLPEVIHGWDRAAQSQE